MREPNRLRRPVLLLSLVAGLGLAGCSHRAPYLRDPIPDPVTLEEGEDPIARLVLVGDAGESSALVLDDVRFWAGQRPDQTVVLFLGDNFYPEGMTRARRDEADRKLLPQIEAASGAGSRALFVPGNHDWADGGPEGYDALRAQAEYVSAQLAYSDGFLPSDGCPGPEALDVVAGLRIIAIDTQWWLHEHSKPVESCLGSDTSSFTAALTGLLETERTVVIAAHHPLFGFGRHAGFSEWREHLLPPIVGTAIALKRKLTPGIQDFGSEAYQSMRAMMENAIAGRRNDSLVIWAAGHEHNLQVLEGHAADYVLISGSAAKTTPVADGPETLFAHSRPGFMVLDLMESGTASLRVIEPGDGEVWATRLAR